VSVRNPRASIWATALSALLVAGCASAPTAIAPDATWAANASGPAATAGAAATALPVTVTDAEYGLLSARTIPGSRCQASLRIAPGVYGDTPPETLPGQSAGPDGIVTWRYSAPRVPSGTASYTLRCQGDAASETKSGNFTITARPIVPTALTVRVTTDSPPREQIDADSSLVPLRDASLAKLRATLADEWTSATRGLGSLKVDDRSPDITMFVIAARGTSVHRTWLADDSQDILIYVSGELGPRSVENNVAVALHEIGHIWCCHGPEATDGGHWAEKQASPGLYGVDRYGLMNEPVLCTQFATFLSCPNRFSDREMLALGFTSFPPPAPDPCITQGLSLRSQINSLESQLTGLESELKRNEATLASLLAQIRAIESQYPGGIPEPTYSNYVSLRSQYNTLYAQYSQRFDQYSAAIDRDHALVAQLNALPCDSS
jgi:hypothetical protein